MLVQDIFQGLGVTGSLILLLIVPFIPLSVALTTERQWPNIVLGAILLGCSMQAVTGLLWSHIVGAKPDLEILAYFFVCFLFTCGAFYLRRSLQDEKKITECSGGHPFLLIILVAAFLVRSIHPLQTFALGQSDAYSHLHYLHYIVEQGYLANVVYPSGYHWLLALPVLVFKIDPYVIVRFGGAFFGTALVLAVYVFLCTLFSRRSAIFGSFCAACFPGMLLLIKTGVGSFANQFGLFLVPCMLYSYACLIMNKRDIAASIYLPAASLGLASSVPIMLIHVFVIAGLERTFSLFQRREVWLQQSARVVVFCLPAVLLIGFHFSQAGSGQRFQTARLLTSYGAQTKTVTEKVLHKISAVGDKLASPQKKVVKTAVESPYLSLIIDFFTVKRYGFSNLFINSLSVVLFALFLFFTGYGIYVGQYGFFLLGIWGGLTAVQASTGFMQFSSYQREGWSLLVATSCLAGVIAAEMYEYLDRYLVVKVGIYILMVLLFCWTVLHPPGHPAMQSSAEDLVVRTVRFLGSEQIKAEQCSGKDEPVCQLASYLDRLHPITLVSRKFIGWQNQGELLPNVLPPESPVRVLTVNVKSMNGDIAFSQGVQYVVLVDKQKKVRSRDLTAAFSMVAPEMVEEVLKQQRYLYNANSRLLEYINQLPKGEWRVRKVVLSKNLDSYVVFSDNPMMMEKM